MPTMDTFVRDNSVKLLIASDSGTGKTGGLASLVDAGYKLRILDFEAKLEPLAHHVKKKENLKNIDYKTFKDEYMLIGSAMAIKRADSFQKGMAAMNKWDEYGNVNTWDKDVIFVIDTLSSMGKASLNMVLMANGFTNKNAEIQHWGSAMESVERVISNLANPHVVPCHLIVLTHLTTQETADGLSNKTYPEALGTKLNPRVPKYFNTVLGMSRTAAGTQYHTDREGLLMCKTPKPLSKTRFPIATGLADIFAELLKS